jgi:stage II sporulation protein M
MKKGVIKKKKKAKFGFKEEYKSCWNFLKESKNFIYSSILIFFIFAVIGFFFQDLMSLAFKFIFKIDLNTQIMSYIKSLLAQTQGMNYQQLLGFILLNNAESSLLGIIIGFFFGIFPLFALIFNGYILGFVAILSVKAQGIVVLWKIFPHGIFELPALFISLGLGLRIGFFIFDKKSDSFKKIFFNSLRVFVLVVLPLLIIAAIIESALIILAG